MIIGPETKLLCIRTPKGQDQVRSGGIYICDELVQGTCGHCEHCGDAHQKDVIRLRGVRQFGRTWWGQRMERGWCPCCFTPLDGGGLEEEPAEGLKELVDAP